MAQDHDACAIRVDGYAYPARRGERLIDCLERHGIEVPHVCYHPGLDPVQTCDVCWVTTPDGPARACAISVRDGLDIVLDSDEARRARSEGVDRILAKHELYCTVCENNNGDCEVHNVVRDMQVPHQHYPFKRKPYTRDESNPFYVYDPDQCILCGRCVEVCQNVEVNETLSIDWDREHPRVLWDGGERIEGSSCVTCGQCVTVCPCNALMERSMLGGQAGPFASMPNALKRPLIEFIKEVEPTTSFHPIVKMSEMDASLRESEIKRTKTVCTYCGVGCSFEMWTRGRHILKVQPSEHSPANGVATCIKGKFGWDFVNSDERLTRPLVREGEGFREASWDEALTRVAEGLGRIKAQHGPDALAFVASSKCSNEESYLMQKLARAVFGTNNVDNCSRYCQNPATKGLFRTVGYGGDSGSISDLEQAEVVFFVGSNTAENHPVIASRLKRAKKLRGQKHIVADPRRHEMAQRADIHLRPLNSTDLVWLCAVTRYILDNGLADTGFLERHVHGVDDYRRSLEPFTLDFAERLTGLSRDELIATAEAIGRAKTVCGVWAMGVTQHSYGSDTSTAISNLLLVTGNYGKPGTGGFPMRGHNNVQGCSDFGSLANIFPGYDKVTDPKARAHWAQGWGVDALPTEVGLNNHTMVEACQDGRLKGMYIMGEEMAVVDANAGKVRDGFEGLDFLVVQDIFFTVTARYADVVLPGCPNVEKDGTFVNTERRIQRFYKVLDPLGQSRPDWRIVTDLAARLGHDWGYDHPSQIMDEVARLSSMFAGVNYERLADWRSLQWPVAADGTDTPRLYSDMRFHFDDGKARLHPVQWHDSSERVDDEYDLHLNNGRMLEHFHEGNMTGRGRITDLVDDVFVEVSPELAEERGLSDGSRVRLVSRRNTIDLGVVVTDRVRGNNLYAPVHTSRGNVNMLTGEHADDAVDTPAFKEIAVRMEVLSTDGEPILPYSNFRYAKRNAVAGVEVTKKWRRDDYVEPPRRNPHPERV